MRQFALMMIARAVIVLFVVVLAACKGPAAQLLTALIPDGTVPLMLKNLERVPEDNRKQLQALETAGRWDEIARIADETIAKEPRITDWWLAAGYARSHLGQHARAAEAFTMAVRLEPDTIQSWNLLAQSYRSAGEPRRAVNALESALNVSRGSAVTFYLLGESYVDLARYEQAAAAYREAVALEPRLAVGWYELTRTLLELNRVDDARETRRQLEKIDPKLAARLDERAR